MEQFYNRCKVQTPTIYVKKMLDQALYISEIFGKKIIEPSFGEGNILVEIVYRYIQDAKRQLRSKDDIIYGLEHDIIGYEIDEKYFGRTQDRLDQLAAQYGIMNVRWNLKKQDFLKSSIEHVDFIVGNPPYITYHDLPLKIRLLLHQKYQACKIGRFDYYYAFIEHSIRLLKTEGRMVFLVPYSILTNKSAYLLRTMLAPGLAEIIDYRNLDVFSKVMCTPISFLWEKHVKKHSLVVYKREKTQKIKTLERESFIKNNWQINEKMLRKSKNVVETTFCMGDYLKIINSVATLSNKTFIFPSKKNDEKYYYVDKYKIEKDITKKAVSAKSLRYNKEMRIIFPYETVEGNIVPITENVLSTKYPFAYKYLLDHKKILLKRKINSKIYWYEYGRKQALDCVSQSKIIMPNIITKQNHAYIVPENTVPYAGVCIVLKNNMYTLEDTKRMLESKEFYHFLSAKGTPTTRFSYRISVNDIKQYSTFL